MILLPLSDESPIIAEAVAKLPEDKYNTGSTSLEWFTRRIKNQRIKNRTVSVAGGQKMTTIHIHRSAGPGDMEGQPWHRASSCSSLRSC